MGREQTRRDAERLSAAYGTHRYGQVDVKALGKDYLALLAELEQSERERDKHWKNEQWFQRKLYDAESRLASVPALVEAGNRIVTAQFGTDDKLVFKQTPETVDALHALRDALTVYEQSQGNG